LITNDDDTASVVFC